MAFSGGQAEMNVTPLIDVLLVLIIIFMIIVPVAPNGENALIPRDAERTTPQRARTVVIRLGNDHSVSINGEPVAWENLKVRLIEIFKERAERVAFVQADIPTWSFSRWPMQSTSHIRPGWITSV